MKKKLSYRDKLLELAYIYNVKEIQEYTKRRKNLTTGQIELILKKNKIIIEKKIIVKISNKCFGTIANILIFFPTFSLLNNFDKKFSLKNLSTP